MLLQPLACAFHAQDQVREVAGKRVADLGQGPISLLLSHVARSRGVVGDRDRQVSRADAASTLGVDDFIHHSTDRWVHALRDDDRPDVVIEAIADGLARSLTRFRPWHLMLWSTTSALLTMRCTAFRGRDASQEPHDQGGDCDATVPASRAQQAIAHLQAHPGLVGAYVTDVFSFANAQDAYVQVGRPKVGQHKVVIDVDSMTAAAGRTT